ncbi:alpha/beta fold family hydrolase [Halosimplex carlsbadense 2-9-1]|uniref:Alpha/beta fold family hydrolase n=1 Tax=Halosimplex carlsbadense 2-9-1 TaxID=797114 RepID=M0CWW1_9EURY|nr:alpha/beta hydrolase [Halosimplex carlsbadense]ELZ27721.1 alpha/beta fold family hydrolase [Halosimplex carlsbadense 2-9-1]
MNHSSPAPERTDGTDTATPETGGTRAAPATVDADEGPRTVEYGAAGRRLAYVEYGTADGDPAVFLHGTPGSRRLGALLHSAAREADVRVIAPDRPGFGRSTDWSGRRPGDAAAWVEPLLADAGVEETRVVAFSGGAADALALGAARPDLVDRIDLVSGAVPPSVAAATPRLQRVLGRLAATTPRLLGAALRGQVRLAERVGPSAVLAQYTDDPGDVPVEVAEIVGSDFLEALDRSRNGPVTELAWVRDGWGVSPAEVTVPVDLWHGGDDANVPVEDAERLRDRLPDAGLTAFDGDHLTTLLDARSRALDTAPRD